MTINLRIDLDSHATAFNWREEKGLSNEEVKGAGCERGYGW